MPLRLRPFLIILSWLLWAGAGHAAQPSYRVAFYIGQGQSTNAQFSSVIRTALDAVAKELNIAFTYTLHKTVEEFRKDMDQGKMEVGFSLNYMPYLAHRGKGQYSPLVTFSFYGLDQDVACLFTNKPQITTPQALKGGTFATYAGEEMFYLLQEHIGANPLGFFQTVKISPNGYSSVFAVAMGEVDGAFISQLSVDHLKLTYPAMYKKIRKVSCAPSQPMAPLFTAKRLPENIKTRLLGLLKNVRQEPAAKTLLPLIRQTNTRFLPVTDADYKPLADLLNRGRSKGWQATYQKWILYAPKTKPR